MTLLLQQKQIQAGTPGLPRMAVGFGDGQSNEAYRPTAVSTAIPNLYSAVGGFTRDAFPGVTNPSSFVQNWANFATSTIMQPQPSLGEPDGFGLGYGLLQNDDITAAYYWSASVPGAPFVTIAPGSFYDPSWSNLSCAITNAIANFINQYALDIYFHIDQGESEEINVSPGNVPNIGWLPITQAQRLAQWQFWTNWNNKQVSFALGRPVTVPTFSNPKNGTQFSYGPALSSCQPLQAADLQASATVPNFWLLPPNYLPQAMYGNGDGVHIQGPGKRLKGETNAIIIHNVLNGIPYVPLQIVSSTHTSSTITLVYNRNVAVETSVLPESLQTGQLHGYQAYTSGSSPVAVNSVVVSGNQVTLNLASNPGSGYTVQVAQWIMTATANQWFPRSNICTADASGTALPLGVSSTVPGQAWTIYDYATPQNWTGGA